MSSSFGANFSGARNAGWQIGQNTGTIINHTSYAKPTASQRKPFSTVPFRRDPNFVERKGILDRLHSSCSPASRVALVGLGGVGKSQIAIQYAYNVRETSPQTYVFWVHVSTRARFDEGFKTIADELGLSYQLDTDILRLVKRWLTDESNGRWLMLVDNADNKAVFESSGHSAADALPQSDNGSIIFTSRNRDVALWLCDGPDNIIDMDVMSEQESLTLLRRKVTAQFPYTYTEEAALELLKTLDYIPLAITQAASYINRLASHEPVARYLELFHNNESSKTSLLKQESNDLRRDAGASHSVITTWHMSFEQLRSERPTAADLLLFMSFFDRQGIPKFMLSSYKKCTRTRVRRDNNDWDGDENFGVSNQSGDHVAREDVVEPGELHSYRGGEEESALKADVDLVTQYAGSRWQVKTLLPAMIIQSSSTPPNNHSMRLH